MENLDLSINSNIKEFIIDTVNLTQKNEQLKASVNQVKQAEEQAFNPKTVKDYEVQIEKLNTDLLEQKKVIKDIEIEEKRLSQLQSKGSKDYSNQLNRVRADLVVAKNEQRKITQEIKQTTVAQKKFEAEIKKTATSAQFMGKQMKQLGGMIAGVFAVSSIISFVKKSAELYDIQDKAETRLQIALKGKEDVQKRLLKQASDLQKVTLYGDEETIKAQALLAAFIKDEDAIKRLIPLIQDFATAKEMDLASAANLVTKSFASGTNALKRYGIDISGVAGSTERLESLTNALSKAFEGQAQAASKAGLGFFQKLGNRIGDLRESFIRFFIKELPNYLIDGANFFREMYNESNLFSYSIEIIRGLFLSVFDVIKLNFQLMINFFKTPFDLVTAFLKDGISGITRQFKIETKQWGDMFANTAKDIAGNVSDMFKKPEKLELLKKSVIDIKNFTAEYNDELESSNELLKEQIDLTKKYLLLVNDPKLIEEGIKKEKELNDERIASFDGFAKQAKLQSDYYDWEKEEIEKQIELRYKQANAVGLYGNALLDVFTGVAQLSGDFAKYEKALAIAEITLNQGVALAKAIASIKGLTSIDYAIQMGVIIGTVTAAFAQITALVAKTKEPQVPTFSGFATGTMDAPAGMAYVGERGKEAIFVPEHSKILPNNKTMMYADAIESMMKGNFDKKYFNSDNIIKSANNYENSRDRGFAEQVAGALAFQLESVNNHDDLLNLRKKAGDSNYFLKIIAENTKGSKSKRMKI